MMSDTRKLARDLVFHACGGATPHGKGEQGRAARGDPVYRAVTEERQERAARAKQFYSSCGDLAHWLLFRLGVRFDWVNRAENKPHGWTYTGQPGKPRWRNNVTTLVAQAKAGVNPWARVPSPVDQFECGDILVVNTHDPNTTHVRVVLEHIPELDRLVTGDYGQPGGAIRESRIAVVGSRLKAGERWVDSVLPLLDVLDAARAVGLLEAPESAEAWAARLGLPLPVDAEATPVDGFVELRRGSRGSRVGDWQVRLLKLGYVLPKYGADSSFGAETEGATRAFQRDRALPNTGVVDRRTWEAARAATEPGGIPAVTCDREGQEDER